MSNALRRYAHALGMHRFNKPSTCRFCFPIGKTVRIRTTGGQEWDITANANGWSAMPVTRELPEERHRLAALALHGQPFGFRHEDCETLRIAAHYLAQGSLTRALDDLAARIAALLPPRETGNG